MSSVAQMLKQAETLKASVSDTSKTISETWVTRQKLEDLYKKLLLMDLEYALDKKVEQELWNHAFKNQITNLQTQAKDKQNVKRAEVQASLNLFLETASGFYLQFLQLICTTFKLDLPFRRKSSWFGILKEKVPVKLKVTPPKKSSCLYVCQHCLVHLGDIARYRQQIDQAQTYYWHAAYLVPFNGQPYNQLAILEAAKGNKLSTVFYYVRSLAVKVPFPVAATNLEKLYAKLAKETPDYKGKLSVSEMITGFLQFHALVHLCTDLTKASELSEKLAIGLPAHVTSQSFPWQVLVQIVAINVFAMKHARQSADSHTQADLSDGEDDIAPEEERCFDLVFTLTMVMLDILLQYTPKQEHKVREYFTLPAVKLLLDWLKLNPHTFQRPLLRHSPLWGNLCKVLNSIQSQQTKDKNDETKYDDLPLPEDGELRCFQPLEKAQSSYSYSRLPQNGIPGDAEVQLRCRRLLAHGRWIIAEFPSLKLRLQAGKSGKVQFTSPTPPPRPVTKSVTVNNSSPTIASPERRSTRQNVAIQAIIQKQQAQDNQDKSKPRTGQVSPKYLLGVPTSEPPVFFKVGSVGSRGPSTNTSPQQPQSPSPSKAQGGQPAGVLVLKNQDHLTTTTQPSKSGPSQSKSHSWQQQQHGSQRQQPVSSWQPQKQQQQTGEKANWQQQHQMQNQSQQKPVQGQGQLWQNPQQQQAAGSQRPQLSPQPGTGQWQFPPSQFERGDNSRPQPSPNMPIGSRPPGPNMSLRPQGQIPSQGQTIPRPPGSVHMNQLDVAASSPGDEESFLKSQDQNLQGHMQIPRGQGHGLSTNMHFQQAPDSLQNLANQLSGATEQFPMPRMTSREMPQGHGLMGQGQVPMRPPLFTQPPPNMFPPPPNFQSDLGATIPPPNLQANQMARPPGGSVYPSNFPSNSSNVNNVPNNHQNYPHPLDRVHNNGQGQSTQVTPQPTRPHLQQNQPGMPRMPLQQGQFMSPFQGYMNFAALNLNQQKSPLEGLFAKPRPQDDLPPNMAEIIGTLSKMAIQPPREPVLPVPRGGPSTFQGHAEGTPKPESYYAQQRSSSVPTVNIDLETSKPEDSVPIPPPQPMPPQQQQQQGTYSLFSGSPWLQSGDSTSIGSSPFSSQSSSIRNSPDPASDVYTEGKAGQLLDLGLRYAGQDDRGKAHMVEPPPGTGPFFQNNVQSIWSSQGQSPLERLLELQKQQRPTDPH